MMNYGTMGFGWLFWIVIIAAIIWLITYITQKKGSDTSGHEGRAIEILKERFARGEISQKEYEEKRKTLSQ